MDDLSCQQAIIAIDGLLDDELPVDAAETLRRHLDGCAACRERLEQRRQLLALLATATPPVLEPDRRARLLAALPRRRRSPWWLAAPALAVAASLALMLPRGGDGVADALLAAHLRALTPGHLVDVESSDRHTVKPWFNGRLALSPPVPDLADRQFPLIGGRLDFVGEQPAACLVYRHDLHVIDLCLWPADGALPKAGSHAGFTLLSWRQDDWNAAVMSDLNRGELEHFANIWRQQAKQMGGNIAN